MSSRLGRREVMGHLMVAARFLVLVGVSLAVVGVAGHFLDWPLLTTTLGPTAYVFAAHPHSEAARRQNAVIGHAVAIAAGLFCLAVFGLWSHPSIVAQHHLLLVQVGAAALAGALTVAGLELSHAHHAPAGATALLVATGISKPGPPLYGLLIGLSFLLLFGPTLARVLPLARDADRRP